MSLLDKVRERLRDRPRVVLKEPLLKQDLFEGGLFGKSLLGSVHGVDGALDSMVQEKRKEWEARGYTPNQINMAVKLAEEWANSMSDAFAPPSQKEASMRQTLPKGLAVADKWLRGLLGK